MTKQKGNDKTWDQVLAEIEKQFGRVWFFGKIY